MTQADSGSSLRKSLDAVPSHAATTLPAGWTAFFSHPDRKARGLMGGVGRWYATAPYLVHAVPGQDPRKGMTLSQTVDATDWKTLRVAVGREMALYRELTAA